MHAAHSARIWQDVLWRGPEQSGMTWHLPRLTDWPGIGARWGQY